MGYHLEVMGKNDNQLQVMRKVWEHGDII
jgi:hypothetical protein